MARKPSQNTARLNERYRDLTTASRPRHQWQGQIDCRSWYKKTLLQLPDVDALRQKTQSLAVLDAILSPDWQYQYYSCNSKWDVDEMMASRKNGCGDELCILFNRSGAILKGFDHESCMSPWARRPIALAWFF